MCIFLFFSVLICKWRHITANIDECNIVAYIFTSLCIYIFCPKCRGEGVSSEIKCWRGVDTHPVHPSAIILNGTARIIYCMFNGNRAQDTRATRISGVLYELCVLSKEFVLPSTHQPQRPFREPKRTSTA